jgi:adenylate cyclase
MKIFQKHMLIAVVSSGLALFLQLLPPGELMELKGYDLFHFFRRQAPVSADKIVIVAIDEPSFAEIGQQWPWPRDLHAQLVNSLTTAGATAIGFDIIFAEPGEPEQDAAFAEAMKQSGRVVLAAEISSWEREAYIQEMTIGPAPGLSESAISGVASIPIDRDYVVRRYLRTEDHELLFAEAMAHMHLKAPIGARHRNDLISFRVPPGGFPTVSYYQAANPELYLQPDFFRGKIVIIGKCLKTATSSSSDYFATPFLIRTNSALMSGVEIQANMIHGMLEGDYVRRLEWPGRILLFAILGLIGALLQLGWKPARGGLLALLGTAAYLLVSHTAFAFAAVWMPTLSAVIVFVIPFGIAGTDAYLASERKKRDLKRAFSHYLSPSIMKTIMEQPESVRLGGQRTEATILFSDIAGFTTISESMPPEEIATLLNIYMTEMTKVIFEHKGTIDKFIGDAIMAFWGAPLPDDDHAHNACSAALAMQKRLASLRFELASKGLPELHARTGINTGTVIAGNMGSFELFGYTVIGDAVNLASRLEGANKDFGTSILISQSVYSKIEGRMEVKHLGQVVVKGKSESIDVYELIATSYYKWQCPCLVTLQKSNHPPDG